MTFKSIDQQKLVRRLQRALDGAASKSTKMWWEGYLKGAIRFRGVGIPQIRSVLAVWRADNGVDGWPVADQFALALRLFEERMAEDKLAGILFLQEHLYDRVPWRAALTQYGLLYERQLISDWNTCDWFCVKVLGPTIAARGSLCAKAVAKWSRATDVWQARSSVVAFVKVVAVSEYHPLLFRSCAVLIRRDERFAKTGVGWILRDLSKREAAKVTAFVEEHLWYFSTESLRNSLKYSPKAEQRRFLDRLRLAQMAEVPTGVSRRG